MGNNDDVIPAEDFAKAIEECRKDPEMDELFSNAPHGAKLLIGLLFYTQFFGKDVDEDQYQAALSEIETTLTPNDIGYLLRNNLDDSTKDYLRGLLAQKDVTDIGGSRPVKLKPVQAQREKNTTSSFTESTGLTEYEKMVKAEARRRRTDMAFGLVKNVSLICVVAAIGYGAWLLIKGEIPFEDDKTEKHITQTANVTTKVNGTSNSSSVQPNGGLGDTDPSTKQKQKLNFSEIKNRVVVIGNEGNGGGTAFLLKMDGKKYLVTNDHVSQSTDSFNRIYLLDGSPIKLGAFEVAEDRDIVRFEVDNDLPALELDESIPEIDEKIVIYGNSMGRGAITEEKGTVKAIGPLRLEVDAKVVPGNSGSPVLNMNGKVIGILTYGTNDMDEDDWQTQNTRYAAVRRWAVRLSGIKWNKVEWNDYVKQTELMVDIRNFRARLNPFIDVRQEDPKIKRSSYGLRYDELTKRIFHREESRFRPHLIALSKANDDWEVPNIGSKVEFYGNADGKDVVTVTAGKIMAVANEHIEIDAPIQGGNSGSPLIRTEDGMVIGVTARTTFNQLNNDPSKIGTRYDPKIKPTREFAERFAGVRWMSLGYEAIVRGAKHREEVRRFLGLLDKFCFATEFCLYRDMPEYMSQFEMPALRELLKKLAKEDDLLRKSRDTFEKMCIKNAEEERHSLGRGTLGSYSRLDFENQIKLMRSRTVKCYEVRGNILSGMEYIIRNVLLWQHEIDFYTYEVNYMFRHYHDKYRFQLRGNNLPGIPSVPGNVRGNSRRR